MKGVSLVCARAVVTMSSGVIPDGALVISDGVIEDIGLKSDLIKHHTDKEVINLGSRIIMPALVNAHTHITLSDAQHVNTRKPYPEWLHDLIQYRRPLTEEDHIRSSEAGLKDLYRNGITTIADSDPTLTPLKTALKHNFRGIFYFEVFGMSAPIQFFAIRKYKKSLHEGLKLHNSKTRFGVSPHTPYTVTPPVFRFASKFAQKHQLPVSTHVAESRAELEFMKSKDADYRKLFKLIERRIPVTKLTPLHYVNSYNLVNDRFMCVHGVHLTDDEFNLLEKSGASLVTCPSSNHNLKAGHLDINKPLNAGVNLCVGSDSPASSDGYDLFHELRLALKTGSPDEVKIDPHKALEMITLNPAKALGFMDEIGSLEKGKYADLAIIEVPDNLNFEIIPDELNS